MRFFTVPISKAAAAKGKRPDAETVMLRAADGTAPSVTATIVDTFDTFRDKLDREMIERLVRDGALDKIVLDLPWPELEDLLSKNISPQLIRAIKRGADSAQAMTARAIREKMGVEPLLTFDGSNPRVDRYISRKTAELVTNVGRESKDAIKQIVRRAMTEELDPLKVFQHIKRSVGLNVRQENALANYRAGLIENGTSGVEKKADAYAEKLLNDRARMIARTETMDAVNQGQVEGIRQARDLGFFGNKQPTKVWMVTDDDRTCDWCQEMDGVKTPLDMPFTARFGKGSVRIDKPPMHPNCRCVFQLVFE